jgi:hypothetical protein
VKETAKETSRAPGKTDNPSGPGPENKQGADKAAQDNDLTTGHSTPGDGGDDNAKK